MKDRFKYGKCIFTNPNLDNINEMLEMMNDPEIQSMLTTHPRTYTYEDEVSWIKSNQDKDCFSTYDANTLDYIGNGGYNEIDNDRGEIGIVIRKQMQGKHYAKDIINGLIDYGFNILNLNEIYAIVFSDNIKSLTCMKELGFTEYDRDKNVIERNGNKVDDIYLSLKRK
ncbi:MAG: GNAT family N-acetyltransferase [Bacilli bacterium]|nr:GNAT family N-acetyltransferase [Bacilli bacterium]